MEKRKILSIDLETFSDVDLTTCGVYRYVEGDFHILLFAYAFDDEDVQIIDLACGEDIPQEVMNAVNDDSVIKSAWNAQFERTCLSKYLGTQLSPDSWQCSMVWAASLSLPLKLKIAAEVLKTGEQKDDAGESLIRYFSVPCRPTKKNGGRMRNLPEHDPQGWQRFKEYCVQDVRTERDIRKRLEAFPLPEHEWDYYHMDQRINDRGVLIDRKLVDQAIACDLMFSDAMRNRAYELTGLENPNSVSQLKTWLEERGIEVGSLEKKDVAALINDLDKNSTDQEALDMMKLRLSMAKSSVKKYQAADRCICSDGRAHGLFQFSGANRTQRWAGRLLQLQNLVRNEISTLDEARELVKMGCFDMAESIYGDTPNILSQLIRTMLVPKDGCQFIVADFSAIEARVLAWLADEKWRIRAFKNGEDIYCASASQMFGVPVVKHGVNGELRQKGKVAELACIAHGQLVLTSKGEVPIENVTKDMKVWDGEEWVDHDGVICRGEREVITYDGLIATEDHLVWVKGQSRPVRFGIAAINGSHLIQTGDGGRAIRLGEDNQPRKEMESDIREAKELAINRGKVRVYDIRNAGRHHRFTVSDKLVHNCGYGGAAGALISMGALDMGLKEEELPDLIADWRNSNPHIVQFWWDVENAAKDTINDHKSRTVKKINFGFHANTLWIELPSGRRLAYIKPKIQPNRFGRMGITYEGLNQSNKWVRQETYSGKLVENCIAAGTLVLTLRGVTPIEHIQSDDLIWDGAEWCRHGGLIDKGRQATVEVISGGCEGIHMTAEHRILTQKGWCKCNEAGGLDWAEVRLPDCNGADRKQQAWKNTMEMPLLLRGRDHHCSRRVKEKEQGVYFVRLYEGSDDFNEKKEPRNEQSSGIRGLALDEAEVRGYKSSRLPQLWGARHKGMRKVGAFIRKFLGRHGNDMEEGAGFGQDRQRWGLRAGELSMDGQENQQPKSKDKQNGRFHVRPYDGIGIVREDRHRGNHTPLPSEPQLADRIIVRQTGHTESVYDIRNCGPRHRFAVYDPGAGCLRIVSNCTQAIARDLLAEAMWRMERAGLDIVGHVHDEVIIEAPRDTVTVDDVCSIMNETPDWAGGLILNSAGYSGDYYFKD